MGDRSKASSAPALVAERSQALTRWRMALVALVGVAFVIAITALGTGGLGDPDVKTESESMGHQVKPVGPGLPVKRQRLITVRSIVQGGAVADAQLSVDGREVRSARDGTVELGLGAVPRIECLGSRWMGVAAVGEASQVYWVAPKGALKIECQDRSGARIEGVKFHARLVAAAALKKAAQNAPSKSLLTEYSRVGIRRASGEVFSFPALGEVQIRLAGGYRVAGKVIPELAGASRGAVRHRGHSFIARYSTVSANVAQGETTVVTVVCERPASVFGTLAPVSGAMSRVSGVLFHRSTYPGLLAHYDHESGFVSEDGSFRLDGVLPGRKKLGVRWRSGNESWSVALLFTLRSGEQRDLGLISPQRGVSSKISFLVKIDGHHAVPLATAAEGLPVPATVNISSDFDPNQPSKFVRTSLDVKDLSKGLTIHGLPKGKVSVSLSDFRWSPRGAIRGWSGMLSREIRVTSKQSILIQYYTRSDSRVLFSGVSVGDRIVGFIRPEEGGDTRTVKAAVAQGGVGVFRADLPSSRVLAYLRTASGDAVFGPALLDFRMSEVSVAMVAGRHVRGAVRGGDRVTVRLASLEFPGFEVLHARPNREGAFSIGPVDPSMKWVARVGKKTSRPFTVIEGGLLDVARGEIHYR